MTRTKLEVAHESGTSIYQAKHLRFALMNEVPQYSWIALFRFSVLSKVLARMQTGSSRADAVDAVTAQRHVCFDGSSKAVSARSLYRWLASYEAAGIAGLEKKAKVSVSKSTLLPQVFIDFLVVEKQRDRPASIPELIRRARNLGHLKSSDAVHRCTVFRACKRLGLPLARCRHAKDRDSKRFAYPHRMDMLLCDGKHFRAGEQRRKRVALFFLDDATRLVLGVVVGTAETKELFLRGLYECIHQYGLMSAVFVDNGPGFIATDSVTIFARLEILLIHGEKGYKEGHGKVERFNRTVKADVLRGLDGRPDVDPDCRALELRLRHYTQRVYAHRSHEGLNGDTPYERFEADPRALRFPASDEDLRAMFEIYVERRVSNDHIVSIDGIHYEMPRGYAGRKLTVRRRVLDGSIVFMHMDKIIELHPVDLAANARAKRAKDRKTYPSGDSMNPPITAAHRAFQDDFKPVVDEDGGFDGERLDTDDQDDNDDSDLEESS